MKLSMIAVWVVFFFNFLKPIFANEISVQEETEYGCHIKDCAQEVVFACKKCNPRGEPWFFCNKHYPNFHSLPPTRRHAPLTLEQYKKFSLLTQDASNQRLVNDYLNNLLFGITKNEVITGNAFDEMQQKYIQNIVSFIGPTGAGKSFLIRALFGVDGPPSKFSLTSTSADMRAYEKEGLVYLDVEGTRGTLTNQAAAVSQYNQTDLLEKISYKAQCYARLAYTFSDIIVYVYCGSPATVGDYVDDLISISNTAAARSVNTSLPSLIIVFNKQGGANKEAYSTKDCMEVYTDKWTQNNLIDVDKLKKFFEQITIVYLPNYVTESACIFEQLDRLNLKIAALLRARKEQKIFLQSSLVLAKMQNITNLLFETKGEAFIDYSEIIANEWSKNLLAYFNLLQEYYRQNPSVDEESMYDFFRQKLQRLIYTRCKTGLGAKSNSISTKIFIESTNEELTTKLPELIRTFFKTQMCCMATHTFTDIDPTTKDKSSINVTCDLLLPFHGEHHKSIEVYRTQKTSADTFVDQKCKFIALPCIWEGNFVPKNLESETECTDDSNVDIWPGYISACTTDVNICCNCIMGEYNVKLSCGHQVCYSCSNTSCPFCNESKHQKKII